MNTLNGGEALTAMRLRGCEAHFTTDLKQISVMWWCELTSFRLLWMSWTFNATVNSFKIKCIWLSMFPWHDSTFCPQSMQCVLFYRCRNYQCVTAMIQKSKKPIARLLNRDWRMIKKSFRPHPVTQKSSSTCRIQEGVNRKVLIKWMMGEFQFQGAGIVHARMLSWLTRITV